MRVEILGGVERRRRWSRDDKMRIIEETLAPGAVVTEIARRHGIATSLVFTWRRRARVTTVASTGLRQPFRVEAPAPSLVAWCRRAILHRLVNRAVSRLEDAPFN